MSAAIIHSLGVCGPLTADQAQQDLASRIAFAVGIGAVPDPDDVTRFMAARDGVLAEAKKYLASHGY